MHPGTSSAVGCAARRRASSCFTVSSKSRPDISESGREARNGGFGAIDLALFQLGIGPASICGPVRVGAMQPVCSRHTPQNSKVYRA